MRSLRPLFFPSRVLVLPKGYKGVRDTFAFLKTRLNHANHRREKWLRTQSVATYPWRRHVSKQHRPYHLLS